VIFSFAGFDLSVDPDSKPVRSGASAIETAATSVLPAGSPLGGAEVVQIVVVRPTSGTRLACDVGPSSPSNVPTPMIKSKTSTTAPSVVALRPGKVSLRR
jgi:hypothetical protein